MEKLFRTKDYILLSLAFLTDLHREFFEPISITCKKIHNVLPPDYSLPSVYNAVLRMYKTREIKKVVKDGKVYFLLASKGKKSIKRKFPLLSLQTKKWDGLWRIVIFDIKEKNRIIRDLLRDKLKNLGFGMWQRSVYISPFNVVEDMREFLVAHGLGNQVFVLVSKRLYVGDEKKLAAEVWSLEKINKVYEELIDEWKWAKARFNKKKQKEKARQCYLKYLEVVIKDPFLPKELLPADWWGIEIQDCLKEWLRILK